MGRQHVALTLAGLNAVLLALLLIRDHQVSAASNPDTLRARAIELVDAQGTVRAQLNVESGGEAVFRLRDSAGQIRVKLGADGQGSGLLLLDGSTEPGIHLLSKTTGTSLTLTSRGGARRVITPVEARPDVQIDHIILGTADLDEGIARFEKRTGVRPAFGGRHPGRGTQNALASLGSGRYVEIIAPQPDAAESTDFRGLRQLEDLTPIGWAVSTKDIVASVQWLNGAGFETSTPAPGSRLRPDGKTLEWATFGIVKPRLERAPFFIRWSSASVHPSADSPAGCALTALNLAVTPGQEDGRLRELLGVGAGRSSSVPMEIVLQCPKGRVRFPAE